MKPIEPGKLPPIAERELHILLLKRDSRMGLWKCGKFWMDMHGGWLWESHGELLYAPICLCPDSTPSLPFFSEFSQPSRAKFWISGSNAISGSWEAKWNQSSPNCQRIPVSPANCDESFPGNLNTSDLFLWITISTHSIHMLFPAVGSDFRDPQCSYCGIF